MSPKKRSTSPSSKNISIGRDVVDSVVIAGDNNIVNYFKGEYVSLKEHYISPDSVFQRVRTEDFVGRDWLTVQVDAFLNDPQRKSGAFLLIGDAGVGKTSFMAHLVKERGYLHLFAEQVPGQAMLQRAIQSLGSQLVTRYQIDPYKDRDTLIQGTVFPDFLERLLRMAASKLTGGEKIVIVCDALDEAGTFPDGNVFGLPNVLPDGVYLILSQRPVNVKLPNLEPLTVRLEAQGADNLGDMEKYLRVVAQRASVADQIRAKNYSDAFFIQTLKEKSLGVWMYLHYVIKEIEQGSRAPLELEALPTGLVGYYADFWGDWRMGRKGRGKGEEAWNALYAPLLTTLAAAQEAITIGTLIQWAGMDVDEDEVARLVAEDWSAFIEEKEVDAETRYKPYHLSFADFIAGRTDGEKLPPAQKNLVRDLAKRTVKAHQRIVKVFEAECNGQWDRLVDLEYPRLHLSAHLNGAGEYETLRTLLTEGDEKIKWAEAREQKEETYAGYLNDLTYVWAYAEREQNYALAIRCMLIENSIHSLAASIPAGLLAALTTTGVWSYTKCLFVIQQKTKPIEQAEILNLIAPTIPQDLLQSALTIANKIEEEYFRFLSVENLVPYLSDVLRLQAIEMAHNENENKQHFYHKLSSLTPYTKDTIKSKATKAENSIKSKVIHELSQFAPHLGNNLNSHTLQEAIKVVSKVQDNALRARALISLVQYLDDQAKSQILTTTHQISEKSLRVNVLASLIPYLNDELKPKISQEALVFSQEIEDEESRIRALIRIMPFLNNRQKFQALLMSREIREKYLRVRVLIALIPYLDNEIKSNAIQDALLILREEIGSNETRIEALGSIALFLNDEQKTQALIVVREIKEKHVYARMLTSLFPSLNDNSLKLQVALEILAALNEIKDEGRRIDVLGDIVPKIGGELTSQKLAILHNVGDESCRVRALAAFIPYINKKEIQEIFTMMREIKDNRLRAKASMLLIPYLDNKTKNLAIQDTLETIRKQPFLLLSDFSSRLPFFLPHLKEKQQSIVIQEGLTITRKFLKKSEHHGRPMYLLSALIPYLDNEIKSQLLQEAVLATSQIQQSVVWAYRTNTLRTLAPHLSDTLILQALTIALESEEESKWRIRTLDSLFSQMDDKTKSLGFQKTLNVHDLNLFDYIIKTWKSIQYKGLPEKLFPFIQFTSQKEREHGVQIVGALTPALVHFSGEEIVPELYRAIQDTARWWP